MLIAYVFSAVTGGAVAAVSTLAFGHPLGFALVVYSLAGTVSVLSVAALCARRVND